MTQPSAADADSPPDPVRDPAAASGPAPGRHWAGRNYTLLSLAAVITNLGAFGALIASAFAVLEAGGSATDVGLVAAARTTALIVFVLVGGAVADRIPRHRVMVVANAVNCTSQGLFAALVITDQAHVWQMVLLSAVGGTGHAFFAPAAEGMVLSSVTGEQAGRAFALFRVGINGAGIGGAALGGAMVAAVGPGWVLAVDAAAFAVAAALRAFLDVSGIPERQPGSGILTDLKVGWREVTGRPWLWSIVLQFAVVNAVVGAAEAVYGPLVAREHLGGAGPWGLAMGAFAAGTLAGALVMTRWKPQRVLFAGALCVFPLALPPAALAVPLPVAGLVGVMFVSGLCVEVFAVAWMMALHQEIPEDKLSRVSSYDWLGSIALIPVATALAGPMQNLVGRSAALWGCAALVVALTAAVLCVPDVRQLRRRTEPAAAGSAGTDRGDGSDAGDGTDGAADAEQPADQPIVKAPSGGSGDGTASASPTG
ncbi:MFS transporter [Streptomyces sp. CMB-StM0423]|uniref:MFS transporter n=1 Tax=Streptomyces sp. CMB-StM0423 TaxID=2059884 RepID=UPI000C702B0F|nr:MFS transporter [Streptomyces sp. CMB-StM0423]AUH44450.1 MFS transporter [Streptomyces sp. CMB-StM0423]